MTTRNIKYSEDELVAALQRNDRIAFEYLYDNYSGAIYHVICKVVKEGELAQDIMQEAFLKIWRNIASYNPDKGRLFTWMINIARNGAIDALRSEGRKPEMDDIQEKINQADLSSHVENPTSSMDMRSLVEKLKPERRLLVDLIYFQGYTHEEVSEKLSIPLGTVKSRIRTALQDLKLFFKV